MRYLYCMYDVVLQEATDPVVCRNDGEALRAFKAALKGMKDPDDQRLYCLGKWFMDAPHIDGSPSSSRLVVESVDTASLEKRE